MKTKSPFNNGGGNFFHKKTRLLSELPFLLKAAPRFELGVKDLQSSALPLGYTAVKQATILVIYFPFVKLIFCCLVRFPYPFRCLSQFLFHRLYNIFNNFRRFNVRKFPHRLSASDQNRYRVQDRNILTHNLDD